MPGDRALITTAELANQLDRPNLRLFDCTTYLEPTPAGSDEPYNAVPGRHTFEAGHIPGADFLDLQGEFSDSNTKLHFMMPDVAQLESAFGRHGISADSHVVLYSVATPMWATRFWWMFQSLGFENAAVLDGGLDKWKAEGRAIETGPAKGYKPTTFTAKPKRGYFVGKHDVLASKGEQNTVVVNRRSARNSTKAWSRAAMAGPGACRAVAICRRRRCWIRRPRLSFRSPKPSKDLPPRASPGTSA